MGLPKACIRALLLRASGEEAGDGGEDAPCRGRKTRGRAPAAFAHRHAASSFLVCEMGTGWRLSTSHGRGGRKVNSASSSIGVGSGSEESSGAVHRKWGQTGRKLSFDTDPNPVYIPSTTLKKARSSLGHFRSCVVERIHKMLFFPLGQVWIRMNIFLLFIQLCRL